MIERKKRRDNVWLYRYNDSWLTYSELSKLPECKVDKTILNSRLSNYFYVYNEDDLTTKFDTIEKCLLPPLYVTRTVHNSEINNTLQQVKEITWNKTMKLFKPGSLAHTVR